jgi:preprotein translocase subunit SecG
MYNFITFVHILTCVILILTILLFQTSKGSALSMFGGGGDAIFSASTGTSFIKKFTIGTAVVFAVTSLLLTLFSSSISMRSVIQQYPLQPQPQQSAPAQTSPKADGEHAAQQQPVQTNQQSQKKQQPIQQSQKPVQQTPANKTSPEKK